MSVPGIVTWLRSLDGPCSPRRLADEIEATEKIEDRTSDATTWTRAEAEHRAVQLLNLIARGQWGEHHLRNVADALDCAFLRGQGKGHD